MAILRELFLSTAPVAGDRVRVDKLLRVILKIILVAALVTMPLYIVGEEFTLAHLWRVLAINGGTALGTLALLQLARLGRTRIVSASRMGIVRADLLSCGDYRRTRPRQCRELRIGIVSRELAVTPA